MMSIIFSGIYEKVSVTTLIYVHPFYYYYFSSPRLKYDMFEFPSIILYFYFCFHFHFHFLVGGFAKRLWRSWNVNFFIKILLTFY